MATEGEERAGSAGAEAARRARDDDAFLPAVELAARIRDGALSSEAAVRGVLERIERVQPRLNPFVTVCAEAAIEAARRADAARAGGDPLGPLHGVPLSVKDIINTAGVRTTWGSRLMADNVPAADAVAVARLKAAGAILVGKTTTSEFAWKVLTDSPLTGVTRNPWNPAMTPGGSSGGAAVAVASGLGPLALATDAGASTRLPAACCGVVGLKPTLGLVPHSQVPDGFNNFIHLGVMARTVADAALMLDVLAGPDASDPHSLRAKPPQALPALARPLPLAGLRIAWRPFCGNAALDPHLRRLCEDVLAALAASGATVREDASAIENAEPSWRVLQQSNWAGRFGARLDEVADRLEPAFVEAIRLALGYSGQDLLQATCKRTQFFRLVQSWFRDADFVVTPTMSRPPLAADHAVLAPIEIDGRPAGDMRSSWTPYLNLFDLTGHPAASVPCGRTPAGLPAGLQIVGPWDGDAAVLRLAAEVERIVGWPAWRPPHAFTTTEATDNQRRQR
jgi:aspartyl-tRNA(Asn)/glutamyl-tRNA(Gln) amidotransferase subunit A